MKGLSPSSATTEPLTISSRQVPVFCMAWMMLRVLSWRSVLAPVPGPTAEIAASAPSTAGLMAAGSRTSAVTTRSHWWAGMVMRAGSRTTAVTSWPAASACWTRLVPVAPVAPKMVSFMVVAFLRGSGCAGGPAGGVSVARTPYRPVQEPGRWRQQAEHPLAGVGRGAVEHPGEQLRAAPQALALPGCLPERGPAAGSQVRVDQRQGVVFLVVHVRGQACGQRAGVFRQAGETGGGEGVVDPGQQRVDAGVLGLHRVEHGDVTGLGDLRPQGRPEQFVLGGVVDVQLVLEGRPAGPYGGFRGPARLDRGGQAPKVPVEGVVRGVHEREVGRAREGTEAAGVIGGHGDSW